MNRRGVLIAALALFLLPATAQAAFPGQNGKLAWSSNRDGNHEIYSMNSDGSGVVRLTNDPQADVQPAWSPDGQEIAFVRFNQIWTMNADGTSPQQVTTAPSGAFSPSWSPDGSRFAYVDGGGGAIYTIGRDGTGVQVVVDPPGCPPDHGDLRCYRVDDPKWSPAGDRIAYDQMTRIENGEGDIIDGFVEVLTIRPDGSDIRVLDEGLQPAWSPAASHIAFSDSAGASGLDVFTMTATGANRIPVVSTPGGDNQVAWSPDGAKLVFVSNGDGDGEIYTSRADGTDLTQLTANTSIDRYPDWQPIPVNAYPRPKGASPMRVSLVTAYDQCTAPNRTHGPPLAFGSCNPPAKSSAHLTVGTGDSNGKPARNEGYLRLSTIAGNPGTTVDEADVAVDFFSDDVFTNALGDYEGELRAVLPLRITDKDNTPHPGGPGAATTQDFTFDVDATCVASTDPQEGSACQTTTTLDALMAGTIKEGRRSVWQLGQVVVHDGGPDGDTATAGNTVFARQGVFVP
jgi:TolB protein